MNLCWPIKICMKTRAILVDFGSFSNLLQGTKLLRDCQTKCLQKNCIPQDHMKLT